MHKRLFALFATLAVAAPPAPGQSAPYEATVTGLTRSVRLARAPDAEVTILSPAGVVAVRPSPDDEVRVDALLFDQALRLDVTAAVGRSSVVVDLKGEPRLSGAAAELTVLVPMWAAVRIHSSTGDVTVIGGDAGQRIEVSSRDGDIRVRGTARSLTAGTFSGAILVDGDYGELTARTATGPITLTGSAATVSTSTLSGLTMTVLTGLTHATFDAVSGDLVLRVAFRDPAPANSLRAETTEGSIKVWAPPEPLPTYRLAWNDMPGLRLEDRIRFGDAPFASVTGGMTSSSGAWSLTTHLAAMSGPVDSKTFLTLVAPKGNISLDTWKPE